MFILPYNQPFTKLMGEKNIELTTLMHLPFYFGQTGRQAQLLLQDVHTHLLVEGMNAISVNRCVVPFC